jgi:hypothetical protein
MQEQQLRLAEDANRALQEQLVRMQVRVEPVLVTSLFMSGKAAPGSPAEQGGRIMLQATSMQMCLRLQRVVFPATTTCSTLLDVVAHNTLTKLLMVPQLLMQEAIQAAGAEKHELQHQLVASQQVVRQLKDRMSDDKVRYRPQGSAGGGKICLTDGCVSECHSSERQK